MSHQSNLISEDILEYLKQHEHKELLRLLTCGSVDDGKSTLIGRLLHDSKMIYEDQLEAIKKDSAKSGNAGEKLDLSLLVDGLQAEREQGITIDVAYRYFSTAKRKFIIADTPGHEQYTRNMATGASTAQLAIILIDARHGVLKQTKRHTFIASLLGIQHILVAVNKMDLVDYSEERYEEIKQEYLNFAKGLTLHDLKFVPISALDGDNVVSNSPAMPWYKDKPLMEILETVEISRDKNLSDFRMPVQYVNRPNLDFRGYSGTVSSGIIRKGDPIMALPSRKTSTVKSIVTFEGEQEEAFSDQAVTLTLADEIDISRGDVLVRPDNVPCVSNRMQAHIVWMSEAPLLPGRQYYIKQATHLATGSVSRIHHQIDVNTLEKSETDTLQLNEIGSCEVTLNQPLVFDPYSRNRTTGAFIIIDRLTNVTIGAGMIESAVDDADIAAFAPITDAEREARNGHKPGLIKVEGELADKLAYALERNLFERGKSVVVVEETLAEATLTALLKAGLLVIATQSVESYEGEVAATVSAADEKELSTQVNRVIGELVEKHYFV
ncbi:sulfate adenylyltransferase subunit CysN [Hahella sp. KA22]|uniref:sulfate adenylyltransferase subunit CysN n=1 Tax=Hahella sp. KA22 TaxID=1628392 RepID=UPI001011688A|nr:sulfate adenylyltransferase subunit CysN [Hahella sp. KA22]QAY54205.1 sulfate adenylyltransferase subunit CysN [Hahella sp. KA22]